MKPHGDRDMEPFNIPGDPSEYYSVTEGPNGSIKYKVEREKIRRLVSLKSERMRKAIGNSEDPYQLSLDDMDAINDFISNEPTEAQVEFLNVLSQETDASTNALNDRTRKLNEQAATDAERKNVYGQVIAVIAIFFVAAVVIMSM